MYFFRYPSPGSSKIYKMIFLKDYKFMLLALLNFEVEMWCFIQFRLKYDFLINYVNNIKQE